MAQIIDPSAATPPSAAKKPKAMVKFGDRRVDNYFWLREKENPEVIDYLKAENAYREAVMKPLDGFRDQLYKEMLSRIKETDESVPYRRKGYWYYQREVEGKQYPIYCRRKGSMEAPEEVILDVNVLAEGKKFTSVGLMDLTEDGSKLAYTVDFTGYRQYTLHVKDLATGALSSERIERVTSATWAADGKTLFYVEEHPENKRSYRLHRHDLGEKDSTLVYEEKDELYDIGVGDTRSGKYLVMMAQAKDTSEVRVLPADKPLGEFAIVEKRKKGHEYFVDHHEGDFFIRTNDKGKNFRIVRTPVATPGQKNWKQVVGPRQLVMVEDIDLFRDFWVAQERDNGLLKLRVFDYASGKSHYLDVPEQVYQTSGSVNREYDTGTYRFVYESMVTPRSWYDYDIAKREKKLLKVQPVLGGYDASQYASEQLVATAKDGTKVPISVVYKKGLKDGPKPLLLYGYGSYGIPMDPNFRSSRISLLDRGMVFAIAHIRGGGDRGKLWYDDGKLLKKKHTFTDFVDCADFLVKKGWTAPDRLVIQGGSAGGLLMGAVTNMRPDLFKAVVTQVPFVDVMSTMLDASLPLTVGEYLEWGNPNVKTYYDYMRSYSPYDNMKKGAYPAMLVETSLNDSQVMYWEPAKYVAKLRTLKTDKSVVLLKTIMEAGHGGASGRYDALKELAFTYSFVLDQVGLAK
ncbi:oligopeptidase B [Betaproteobacteria bacterium GR16-43]|nr:oligopeptidase B [Betaproteobacteria bacterium GR16-43]